MDEDNDIWYWDVFTSPDGHAGVESIVYDDGEALCRNPERQDRPAIGFTRIYSSTGQEGDIRISDDSTQKDGSERLTWTSKGGDWSGISFFEIRKTHAPC